MHAKHPSSPLTPAKIFKKFCACDRHFDKLSDKHATYSVNMRIDTIYCAIFFLKFRPFFGESLACVDRICQFRGTGPLCVDEEATHGGTPWVKGPQNLILVKVWWVRACRRWGCVSDDRAVTLQSHIMAAKRRLPHTVERVRDGRN